MAKFEFPRNPNADRENPFEDQQGANPFGEDAAPNADADDAPATDEENPYSAAESSAVQPYRPDDYEMFLPNRSALVLWTGLVGCGIELLAILVAVIAILAIGDFFRGMAFGLPAQLIGVAVSAPAWGMGQSDLSAIAAGAMQPEGRRATRWGWLLGIVGTLLGATQLLLFFGFAIFEAFFA